MPSHDFKCVEGICRVQGEEAELSIYILISHFIRSLTISQVTTIRSPGPEDTLSVAVAAVVLRQGLVLHS